jgi:hypothetical protein
MLLRRKWKAEGEGRGGGGGGLEMLSSEATIE